MSGRVTPLARSLLTVVAWAISLAVLTARAELLLVALPLALAAATLARRPAVPGYALTCDVSADRIFEGETLTVTISVTAAAAIPLVLLRGPLPADTELASGRHRAAMTLRAGQTATWRYEVRAPVRGAHDLGAVLVHVRDRWSMRAWERRHVERRVVHVYPRVAVLRSLPRPLHTQTSVGDYVSPALGEGIEPGDVRQFAPGDQIRQVNWRASLRLGTLYVTQHRR